MADPTTTDTYQLGSKQGYQPYPFSIPAQGQTWQVILSTGWPRSMNFVSGITSRLAQHTQLAQPNYLQGEMDPVTVNGFLQVLNTAFPRDGSGPRTIDREVAATTGPALTVAFPEEHSHFHHIGSAIQQHPSGASGTLTLVATGPNIAWAHSNINHGYQMAIQDAIAKYGHGSKQQKSLVARQKAAKNKHESGQADWHNVVTYIRDRKTFLYDPSGITHSTSSAPGQQLRQQLDTDTVPVAGIDCRGCVYINMAVSLYAHGFNNTPGPHGRGRLGRRSNARGAWIGGGGNAVQLIRNGLGLDDAFSLGQCRTMCGNWIVVVHVLQWVVDRGQTAGLTADQVGDARFNLDWLLGGFMTGESNDMATQQGKRLEWISISLY